MGTTWRLKASAVKRSSAGQVSWQVEAEREVLPVPWRFEFAHIEEELLARVVKDGPRTHEGML